MKQIAICLLSLLIAETILAGESDKPRLAESLLEKLDLPRRYNESVASKAVQAAGPEVDPKTAKWMRDLFIQELGWQKAKGSVVRHYSEKFTEAELRELLMLLDKPLVKKLLQSEVDALEASSQERAERFAKFWVRYNNLEFDGPR